MVMVPSYQGQEAELTQAHSTLATNLFKSGCK